MLRSLAFGAVVLALVSAYALYSINMRTRVIAREVKAKEARKQKLIESIAVLKAERAFRARPEVIGPLAEKLGMRPVDGRQFIERAQLPRAVANR